MANEQALFERSIAVYGQDGFLKLKQAKVAVFGLGGVGSYVAEALVRAGIGHITLIDGDTVEPSNINRQLLATTETIGQEKAKLAAKRAKAINPDADIEAVTLFYGEDTQEAFPLDSFSYIADCVDDVAAKLLLAQKAQKYQIPIISSMGTAMRSDPTRFRVGDVMKSSVCPLAKVMRYELRKRGIRHLMSVWSDEPPVTSVRRGESLPSLSFVPPVAGMLIAGTIIKEISGLCERINKEEPTT